MDQLINPQRASEILGISRKTLNQLCRDHAIAFVQVNGRDRKFTAEGIQEYIQSRTVPRVDRRESRRLPSPAKIRKGGESEVPGCSVRSDPRTASGTGYPQFHDLAVCNVYVYAWGLLAHIP